MKKVVTLLLTLTMAMALLAGCGGDQADQTEPLWAVLQRLNMAAVTDFTLEQVY